MSTEVQKLNYLSLLLVMMMISFIVGNNIAHGQFSLSDRVDNLEYQVSDLLSEMNRLKSQQSDLESQVSYLESEIE